MENYYLKVIERELGKCFNFDTYCNCTTNKINISGCIDVHLAIITHLYCLLIFQLIYKSALD